MNPSRQEFCNNAHIDREMIEYDTGVAIHGLTNDTEVGMTGILIGSMQEFA